MRFSTQHATFHHRMLFVQLEQCFVPPELLIAAAWFAEQGALIENAFVLLHMRYKVCCLPASQMMSHDMT